MSVMIIISIIISLVIVLGSFYLNTQLGHFDKLSQYECGFEPHFTGKAGKRFYIKYYKIGIIFLIFDLEAILLYPFTTIPHFIPLGFLVFLSFMTILILGLIYEYSRINY